MRKLLIFSLLSFAFNSFGQVYPSPSVQVLQPVHLPPEVDRFHQKIVPQIRPAHATWVKKTASTSTEEAVIRKQVSAYAVQNKITDANSIEALIMFVMMEVSKANKEDLNDLLKEVEANRKKKEEIRKALALLQQKRTGILRKELDSLKQLYADPPSTTAGPTSTVVMRDISAADFHAQLANRPVTEDEVEAVRKGLENKRDELNDLGAGLSLRLQQATERYNKAISTISNIQKKISETSSTIIQNLK